MANGRDNLRSISDRSTEEQWEIRSKGGKASVAARRKKKELKELLEIALSQPCKDGSGQDNWTAITVALLQKALSGDTKAYEVVRDTLGQKPTDKLEADLKGDIDINISVED